MTGTPTPAAAPRIAVVGLAGRFPGAPDAAALWRDLAAGVESIGRFDEAEAAAEGVPAERLADPAWVRAGGVLDGAERFDAAFFGVTPREAEGMDPQHRLFLECAWNALEDAGRAPGRLGGRVGVFAGAGRPDYLLDHVRPRLGDGGDFATAYAIALGNDRDFLATRLSWKLDLTGPSLTVATACSTSLVAVCLAATALAAGDCDLALAGGAALRLPQRGGYPYTADGILSPDGRCRAFDADAQGTVPGSGVGVVLLKRLEDALADGDPVRAVLCGWAVNNDGAAKVGYTAPRAEGQAAAIGEALALAGFEPGSIGYVEAHGTGTALGDPIEVAALRQAFGDGLPPGSCALGSIKSNLGHLDAAAGVAGFIKAALVVEHGEIPPSLHFETPNPRLELESSP
ncbi:MAG TPA: polyketide synthase, partial [Thermoanaerobaculia bacterium]